jgi:hypothetical protein
MPRVGDFVRCGSLGRATRQLSDAISWMLRAPARSGRHLGSSSSTICLEPLGRAAIPPLFIGRRASLKRSLTGESASSGVGSKHGSVVLLLREIVMGEQAGPCLVQLLSPSNEYALAFRRKEIKICFEFAI